MQTPEPGAASPRFIVKGGIRLLTNAWSDAVLADYLERGWELVEAPSARACEEAQSRSAAIVDEHGHALGCPAYNQPTFTLCTCGAAERAGLDVKFSAEKTGDAATMCLLSCESEPIICDGGCGLSKCPKASVADVRIIFAPSQFQTFSDEMITEPEAVEIDGSWVHVVTYDGPMNDRRLLRSYAAHAVLAVLRG